MIDEPFHYGKAALVGFLAGSVIFLFLGLAITMESYLDQLRIYFATVAICMLAALAASFVVNWRFSR